MSMKARAFPKARNRSRYRSPCSRAKKRLTDAEIDAAAEKIVAEVARKTGAELRG